MFFRVWYRYSTFTNPMSTIYTLFSIQGSFGTILCNLYCQNQAFNENAITRSSLLSTKNPAAVMRALERAAEGVTYECFLPFLILVGWCIVNNTVEQYNCIENNCHLITQWRVFIGSIVKQMIIGPIFSSLTLTTDLHFPNLLHYL